ncbi:MAG: transcriptional repressor [Clostridiales bacterium]|jgi:Fur family peroxide stress response transcriptional regulator|nr:transcriptional repressor [Clostridiales bacterium]
MTRRKHSKKRDQILYAVQSTQTHPSAQWVYERIKPVVPEISLSTVYRNMSQLKDDGLVASLGVVDGEERFDGTVEPHPHFICARCKRVYDLAIEKGRARALSGEGHEIDFRLAVYRGLCKDCYGLYKV